MGPWWLERLALVGILLWASAFFSGSETALFSLSRAKREAMGTRNQAPDRAVLRLLAAPRRLIVTVILCNELVNVAVSTLMAGFGQRWVHWVGVTSAAWATVIVAAVTVPVMVLLGDMTPKTIAFRTSERWARAVARPLEIFQLIVMPARIVLSAISGAILGLVGARLPTAQQGIHEEEFRALVDVGEKEGEVEGAERRLIHNVFEFGDRNVGEVMTRSDRLFALPYEMPLGRMVEAVSSSRYSRVPIYRRGAKGRIGEVVGILHAKDLVGYSYGHLEGHTIADLLHPPFFVPRSTKCDRLFREFQRRKTHVALVVDEYGRLAGLVTMEDLLEELFGEIVDEKEAPRAALPPGEVGPVRPPSTEPTTLATSVAAAEVLGDVQPGWSDEATTGEVKKVDKEPSS